MLKQFVDAVRQILFLLRNLPSMNVTLTPVFEEFVRRKVEAGES